MTTPNISEYLKYANLQMAAEAFLVDANGNPLPGDSYQQPKGSESFDFLST